jgi:iron-sulfur cluster assembly protein/iron-sulfur cluster insertion protein
MRDLKPKPYVKSFDLGCSFAKSFATIEGRISKGAESTMTTTNVSLTAKVTEPITLTDTAITKVAELIAAAGADEPLALRVAVKSGGCSGFNYDMYFDSEVASDDVTSEFAGVRVVVDPASAELLNGATLDFSDGLQGAGFHITNPNATRTCGCGNSFS